MTSRPTRTTAIRLTSSLAAALLLGRLLTAAGPSSMTVTVDDRKCYHLGLGGENVTRYYTSSDWAKPFFFPLVAPNGVGVTRGWPVEPAGAVTHDHIHQKSAWFAHGEVTLDAKAGESSRPVDFWAEAPGHGVIALSDSDPPRQGSPLRLRFEWRGPDGKPILTEGRSITLNRAAGGRLVAVEIDLRAEFGPVVFGDTKEGAFAVRVHDKLRVGDKGTTNSKSRITNADGKAGEKACWGRPSDWCDYSGEIEGKPVGIALFDHPANRPRACWHVRDYGLMAANPFGRAKSGFPAMHGRTDVVRLKKDEHLRLRYAIFLHDGDAASGRVTTAFEQFVNLKD